MGPYNDIFSRLGGAAVLRFETNAFVYTREMKMGFRGEQVGAISNRPLKF